jgi:site-specific recombinase XerD
MRGKQMSFLEITEIYLSYLLITGQNASNAKTALSLLSVFLNEASLTYLCLRLRDAENFLEKLCASGKYAKATVLNITGRLYSFYEYLVKQSLILSNPFAGVYRPKRPKALPRNVLTKDETETLLAKLLLFNTPTTITERRMKYKAHLIAELMYATGLRRGEVCRLTCQDIDTERSSIRVKDTKANKERTVFLNDYCRQLLSLYLTKVRPFIITDCQNRMLVFGTQKNIGSWFNALLAEMTKELEMTRITAHSFRHSFGIHLLANGCDIRYIKEMLGHSSLHTTQIYTRVDKHDLSRIIDECHPRTLLSCREQNALFATAKKPFHQGSDNLTAFDCR